MNDDLPLPKKSMQTELSVLRLIHGTPRASRVELANISGLSAAAMTGIVNSLLDRQLILEEPVAATESGRKRIALALRPELACVAGIDLGTINLRICIADLNGSILIYREIPSDMARGREDVLSRMFALLREMIELGKIGPCGLQGIGIGFSGVIDIGRGYILSYPRPGQQEQWRNIPLRDRLEQEFHVPVLLEDSVRAIAVTEKLFGIGRDFRDFVYVDVGVGVGAAIFIDGRMYRGHNGSAGEFGHMTVDEHGPICCCGSSGCLEAVASGGAIIESVKLALRRGVSSKITEDPEYEIDRITLETIADAAAQNDSLSYRCLSEAASHIGAAAADIVNLLNPETLIFGGALFRAAPEMLIEQINATIRHRAMEKSAQEVLIQASTLTSDAGARGAARLIATQLIDKIYRNVTAGQAGKKKSRSGC
jgi:glucokinase-like ROK family protein